MSFSELNIHADLLQTLEKLGYDAPTPVQSKTIPKIINGFDLRVSAPTGTGKTAAFILPSITRLATPSPIKGRGPRMLILVPTRELAIQVAAQAEKYSKAVRNMRTVCIYGGVSYYKQNQELARPHDIIVATPGRFIDLLDRKSISLSRLEIFVLDEADRMLDMGFSEPVLEIAAAIPTKHQTLLFSATLEGSVMQLSNKLLTDPLEIIVHAEVDKGENIDQRLHYVDDIHHKNKLLDHILKEDEMGQTLVFTATKRQADRIAETLQDMNYSVAALHGDMSQERRTKTIMRFRSGKLRILVATDVAARGLDVKDISHVINFDLPTNTEDYIHRIGRTGRAGATGIALSFATNNERSLVNSIERFTGKTMTCNVIPGLEPTKKFVPKYEKRSPRNSNMKRKFSPGKQRGARSF